jgi:hypothetical protein
MYEYVKNYLSTSDYNYDDVEDRIKKLYASCDLTEAEKDELLALAAEKVNNAAQVDLFAMVVDLQHRVRALETKDFPVWTKGYVTNKNEIVKFDIDGDGEYELCMYAGSRENTTLAVGQINGWYLVNPDGTKTHKLKRNEDKVTYTITPIA